MSDRRVVNHTRTDLHPGDHANRVALRDYLRRVSVEQGYREPELSAVAGYGPGWAKSIWAQTSWRLATIQQLARALKLELTFIVDTTGLKLPPQDPYLDVAIQAYDSRTAEGEEVARRWLADLGRRVREALGVERAQLGHVLHMAGTRIKDWESGDGPQYLMLSAQRYLRALGRPLSFRLVDENGDSHIPAGSWITKPYNSPEAVDAVQVREGDGYVFMCNPTEPDTIVKFPADVWHTWMQSHNL